MTEREEAKQNQSLDFFFLRCYALPGKPWSKKKLKTSKKNLFHPQLVFNHF